MDSVSSANFQVDGASVECHEAAVQSFIEMFCLPFGNSTANDITLPNHPETNSHSSGRYRDKLNV